MLSSRRTAALEGCDAELRWARVATLGSSVVDSFSLAGPNGDGAIRAADRRRIAERQLQQAHDDLRYANAKLEDRVEQRTIALKRANEELERFAYIASHDLRAPLRALMTLPDWLREDLEKVMEVLPDDVSRDLDEMKVQSVRMDNLLTDLLTYARLGKAGDLEKVVDGNDLIAEAVSLVGLPEGFRINLPGDIGMIRCIPAEFSLVIRNLVCNAIKHHDRATGEITIMARRRDGRVTFEISDDGPGVPARFSEKVFEMFSTLRPRDEVEGSGMGLAMVRKIVENMGGAVRLSPARDDTRGARFELSFPQERIAP